MDIAESRRNRQRIFNLIQQREEQYKIKAKEAKGRLGPLAKQMKACLDAQVDYQLITHKLNYKNYVLFLLIMGLLNEAKQADWEVMIRLTQQNQTHIVDPRREMIAPFFHLPGAVVAAKRLAEGSVVYPECLLPSSVEQEILNTIQEARFLDLQLFKVSQINKILRPVVSRRPRPSICYFCNNAATTKCGKCGNVWYCNRDCQKYDWKTHRQVCEQSK